MHSLDIEFLSRQWQRYSILQTLPILFRDSVFDFFSLIILISREILNERSLETSLLHWFVGNWSKKNSFHQFYRNWHLSKLGEDTWFLGRGHKSNLSLTYLLPLSVKRNWFLSSKNDDCRKRISLCRLKLINFRYIIKWICYFDFQAKIILIKIVFLKWSIKEITLINFMGGCFFWSLI